MPPAQVLTHLQPSASTKQASADSESSAILSLSAEQRVNSDAMCERLNSMPASGSDEDRADEDTVMEALAETGTPCGLHAPVNLFVFLESSPEVSLHQISIGSK